VAHDYRLPPTRYLGLPWPEWGETDFQLTQAFDCYRQNLCPCGCGQWRSDCLDLSTAGRWQIEVDQCQAAAARAEWLKANPELPEGTLVGVRLLPAGETPTDPMGFDLMGFDPEAAAAEHAEMQRRFGLAT
jgi:hypothetical protein